MRRLLICSVLLMLGGCQLALPGGAAKTPKAANPITGGEITVTSLDAPKQSEAVSEAAPTTVSTAAPKPAPTPTEPAPQVSAAPTPEVEAAPAAAVVVVKSPAHLACEKKGGRWSMAGSAKASFCQTPTKDAGKLCRKETDCEGYCLAKSGTCAPYTPLFGCNEILTPDGRMVTQCIN